MIERRRFLLALWAWGFGPALLGADRAGAPGASLEPLAGALVLSGGGARGAYEAGVVGGLAARGGVRDGQRLPPYEVVCGTSIGALNGWFVATGQYEKLRELWYGISREKLIQAKSRYAALRDSQSGLLDRAGSALSLIALVRDQRGLLQSEPVRDWIARNVDPAVPLLVPLLWGVTNLAQQRPEYFYVTPEGSGAELPRKVVNALHILLGPQTVVREATADLLHDAIFASSALPIAFDPVIMPGPDGVPAPYCDGGIATNSPVGVAHAVATSADVVLLDPPFEAKTDYHDAVEIAFGAYGTMQRKIIEVEMRNAYFQSVGKRAIEGISPSEVSRVTRNNPLLATFMHSVTATELRYIRPEQTLPLGVVGFNDEVGIGKAYRQGWEDVGSRGFVDYDWRTFQL
ncbi:MAG TPA: patatin-like phospholipase family protein [Candidatus Binatia bacterium]|nr:patatin-like phospholipase family protein [Candidatus Binatia bacterium]